MTTAATERGRQTRERLVAAAAELIREQGVEKTSIDQILSRTGTSKSQLYHYFADKEALVREVIAFQTDAVVAESLPVMEAVTSWSSLRAWFEAIVEAHEAESCKHGCPVGSLAAELADQHDAARGDLADSFSRWEGEIVGILERLKANGRLRRRADTAALATSTLASIQGGLLLSKTQRDPLPLRRALDAAYVHLRSFARASNEPTK
jgi:TetR/AcrR family transcriptional repressor of nem operon